MPLDPLNGTIRVGPSRFGNGVFAVRDIARGEAILSMLGPQMTGAETEAPGVLESHTIQVGDDLYYMPDAPGIFINHSCEPNCGLVGGHRIIARRDIPTGEELSFDYSTCVLERHWTLECHCGSASCRGVVRDFDQLPGDLQRRYLDEGIVTPFIVRRLNSAR